jgi:hypothetical protein
MKQRRMLAGAMALAVVLALLAAGCNSPVGNTPLTPSEPGVTPAASSGQLSLRIAGDDGFSRYALKFTALEGQTEPAPVYLDESEYVIELAEGDWTIDIIAFDDDDIETARRSVDVTVGPGGAALDIDLARIQVFTSIGDLKAYLAEQSPNTSSTAYAISLTGFAITQDDRMKEVLGGKYVDLDLSGCTGLGEAAFYECATLIAVRLPAAVTEIPIVAFYATGLRSVEFPATVTSIGGQAFARTPLRTVTFPASLRTIGTYAFNECESLYSADFSAALSLESIDSYAFYYCHSLLELDFTATSIVSIGYHAFSECESLKTVKLPSANVIITDAFYKTEATLVIPDTFDSDFDIDGYIVSLKAYLAGKTGTLDNPVQVTVSEPLSASHLDKIFDALTTYVDLDLSGSAMSALFSKPSSVNVKNIVSLKLPAWVTTIYDGTGSTRYSGNGVFTGFTSLKTIVMPGVKKLGSYAFWKHPSIKTVDAPIVEMGGFAFLGSAVEVVDWPNVKTIGWGAFYECASLKTVDLPNATTVEGEAFSWCKALTSVNLPEVLSLGQSAFAYSDKLVSVSAPKITELKFNTFRECLALETYDLPNVEKITGDNVFWRCDSITAVDFPKLTEISSWNGFSFGNLQSVNLPELKKVVMPPHLSPTIGSIGLSGSFTSISLPKLEECQGLSIGGESLVTIDLPNLEECEVLSIGYNSGAKSCPVVAINVPKLKNTAAVQLYFCTSLVTLDLPELTELLPQTGNWGSTQDASKIWGNTNLQTINIPKVTSFSLNYTDARPEYSSPNLNLDLSKVTYITELPFGVKSITFGATPPAGATINTFGSQYFSYEYVSGYGVWTDYPYRELIFYVPASSVGRYEAWVAEYCSGGYYVNSQPNGSTWVADDTVLPHTWGGGRSRVVPVIKALP